MGLDHGFFFFPCQPVLCGHDKRDDVRAFCVRFFHVFLLSAHRELAEVIIFTRHLRISFLLQGLTQRNRRQESVVSHAYVSCIKHALPWP